MKHLLPRPMHALALLVVSFIVLAGLLADQRISGSLLPHGYCFTWNTQLLAVHVASDILIGMAYISIPLTLVHLVRKRGDLPFNWLFLLFALFIVSCGATHWMEVWTIWRPNYWMSGSVKALTAGSSVLTAVAFVRLLPAALAFPTAAELKAAKQALEAEIEQRRVAEQQLRQERESLARRVEERTQELELATASANAARAQAERANKLKDQFLARVSHELRTPLQATMGWVQVLGHGQLATAQTADAVDRIKHNVEMQARMIDDLLDIARILSGKLRLELQPVDPNDVVRRAIDAVRPRADQRRIHIDAQLAFAGLLMVADPARLEQLLWNLLSNAIQASSDGARIMVRAHADQAQLHLEVQDWGKGIAQADLPFIFEPFRQLRPDAQSHGGLGLGLAIAQNIVSLFGGRLHAASSGEGQGATFSIDLPIRTPSTAVPVNDEPLTPTERETLRDLRVLYVENSADVAEATRLLLTDLGMHVTVCCRFDEAAVAVRQGGFDVLLADLQLDGQHSGYELDRLLRAMPAVALTSLGAEEDFAASAQAGFVAHLVKPVTALRMGRAIANAVRRGAIC